MLEQETYKNVGFFEAYGTGKADKNRESEYLQLGSVQTTCISTGMCCGGRGTGILFFESEVGLSTIAKQPSVCSRASRSRLTAPGRQRSYLLSIVFWFWFLGFFASFPSD